MSEEEKIDKSFKLDISKQQEPNYYKKVLSEIINDIPSKQKAFFCSLPTNIDLSALFKSLDQPTINFETKETIQALLSGANICNRVFPYSLFLIDWNNKRAQLNFVSFLLENKIDLSSSVGLTKIIKPDYITDSVYYLNSVELFRCIASLNNRSLIMKIKQDCPEMCVLGLSHVLPKFADIFDDLFLKTIDKYRQLNSLYSTEKPYSGHYTDFKSAFYSYQDSSFIKNPNLFVHPPSIILQAQQKELKIIEKQSYILNILLIQKKVIHKLSLVPLNIALNLVIENNCFEQILSLNSDLSYNILMLGYQNGLYDLRTVLVYRVKNDLFIHNLLVYLTNKNIEFIIPVINALSLVTNTLKPDSLNLFNKLKDKIETHYLFLPFSALSFNNKPESDIQNDITSEIRTEKYMYPKYIKEKIEKYSPEAILSIESNINAIYNYRSGTIEKNLEPFKNIQKLKKIAQGTIYQRNFINKLSTYFINNLDPFVEDLYEEGLLCENQAKIAAKIIYFYKSKRNKGKETKKKSPFSIASLGIEPLDSTTLQTFEQLFIFKLDNFAHENMFKYIISHLLIKDWLSVVEFCYELKNESFIENFVIFCFSVLKNYLIKLIDSSEKKDKDIELENVIWFIHLGLVLSELTTRKYLMVNVEVFDFKAVLQKSIILGSNELLYFISYFFLNSKNKVFTGHLRYLKNILTEIMAYKEDLPFFRINLNLEKEKSNFYLGDEIFSRLNFFNEKYSEKDNLKKILADYFEFTYLSSNVICKSEHLANYVLPDNVHSSIIQMAIDVSVKDICKTLVERTIGVVEKTIFEMQKLYSYKNVHNMFLNLCTRLIHINSYEPLNSCIKNNIINFLKLCNLDINKVSITHIIESNIELCITLLKREVFTRINNNSYQKERNISEGKNAVNIEILNNLNSYDPIVIKELKDEDLEEIKCKLTGITRDIPNTKLYVLTEQWRNFIIALEAYEFYEQFDELDEYYIEETIAKFENENNKDPKESLKELSIKEATIKSTKLKNENKHSDVKFFFDYKLKKETLIMHSKSLLNLLMNAEEIDSLAETLCKHIIGYLQHKILHFMFIFLNEIFKLSFLSYLTVKHYLLFGTASFNKLIYYSIENKIIPILEFDQMNHLEKKELSVKNIEEEAERVKTIINLLVLRNKKICTIYDFVYTLERVSKFNSISFIDHMVVNLKGFNLSDSAELFDEFIKINKFTFFKKIDFIDFVKERKSEKIKQVAELDPSEEASFFLRELYNAFNFSWDHFLKYHRKMADFSCYKLDTIIENCSDNLSLLIILKDLIDSSFSYDNMIFFKFVNRAIFKLLSKINESEQITKISDEKNPYIILLRAIGQMPQYMFHLYYFAPLNLRFIQMILDWVCVSPSLLKQTILFFTENFLCSFKDDASVEEGRMEVITTESGTEYRYITETEKNILFHSLEKANVKAKMVLNNEYSYVRAPKENVLLCNCKNCEEINGINPFLNEEGEKVNKKESYSKRRLDAEDEINILEILTLGCKKYFAIFAYLVNPKFPELKNMFMTTYIPNNDALKKIDYFKIRNLLNKRISAWAYRKYKGYIIAVVDSLFNNYFDEIHLIIKENYKVNELINCLQSRASCFNTPICIAKAMEIINLSNLLKK